MSEYPNNIPKKNPKEASVVPLYQTYSITNYASYFGQKGGLHPSDADVEFAKECVDENKK